MVAIPDTPGAHPRALANSSAVELPQVEGNSTASHTANRYYMNSNTNGALRARRCPEPLAEADLLASARTDGILPLLFQNAQGIGAKRLSSMLVQAWV